MYPQRILDAELSDFIKFAQFRQFLGVDFFGALRDM
jgi:hypothetical protein